MRVNAVAPGPFWTPLQPSGGQPQDKIEQFGSETPMGRPGQPAEIAPLFYSQPSSRTPYRATGSDSSVFGTGNQA